MRKFLIPAFAVMFALTAIAADKSEPLFKKGPSTAQLKAKNEKGENWEGPHVPEIKSFKDWENVLAESKGESIFVVKHSTECPVNARSSYRLNQWLDDQGDDAPKMYYVKVIETRPVSQKIEADLKIKHESPQILLVQNGKGAWSTSHDDITAEAVENAIRKFGTSPESD